MKWHSWLVAALVGCGDQSAASHDAGKRAVLLSAASDTVGSVANTTVPTLVRVAGTDGVILPAVGYADRAWTPTVFDIEHFEAGLETGVQRPPGWEEARWRDFVRRWRTYARQYSGRKDDARRVIRALLSCDKPEGWADREVVVEDGGDCYVDVTFDLLTGRYYVDLRIGPW